MTTAASAQAPRSVLVHGQQLPGAVVVRSLIELGFDARYVPGSLPGPAGTPSDLLLLAAPDPDSRLVLRAHVETGSRVVVLHEGPDLVLGPGMHATAVSPRAGLGALQAALAGDDALRDGPSQFPSVLTERERQVLTEITRGARNGEIAAALGISPNTARTHVQNVLGKLGATNRLEAVASAHRRGLIEVRP